MKRTCLFIKTILYTMFVVILYGYVCDVSFKHVLDFYGASGAANDVLLIAVFFFWLVAFLAISLAISDKDYLWGNCDS